VLVLYIPASTMSDVFYSNASPSSVLYIAVYLFFFLWIKDHDAEQCAWNFVSDNEHGDQRCIRLQTDQRLKWFRQVLLWRSVLNCSVTNRKAVECTVFLLPNAFPSPICWRDIQGYLGRQRVRSVCILIVCTRSLFLNVFIGNYYLLALYVNLVKVSAMKLIFQAMACTSLQLLFCK